MAKKTDPNEYPIVLTQMDFTELDFLDLYLIFRPVRVKSSSLTALLVKKSYDKVFMKIGVDWMAYTVISSSFTYKSQILFLV